ncbi:Hypothetical predicted protein [Cloeon dipterum]|uniref:Uncharacterized protein n=1 Tax=Cloeon dipterum TaxID=197152 RepID=A0A8S1D8B9_9INSE|nr:Hypothetical predicted protein [Cloeon dipterum]
MTYCIWRYKTYGVAIFYSHLETAINRAPTLTMAAVHKYLCALAFLSAIVAILASGQGSDRQKRAILKAVKVNAKSKPKSGNIKVVCKKEKFINLRRCCVESLGNFFTLNQIQTCTPERNMHKRLLSYANYVLNTFMTKDNTLDWNTLSNNVDFKIVANITRCLFNFSDTTNLPAMMTASGKILYDVVATHFAKAIDEKDAMLPIVTACGADIDAKKFEPVKLSDGRMSTTEPIMLIQCVRQTFLTDCTSKSPLPANCDKDRLKLLECKVFNTTIG